MTCLRTYRAFTHAFRRNNGRNTELFGQYTDMNGMVHFLCRALLRLLLHGCWSLGWSPGWSPLCMAVKLDISVLLEAVGAEVYTEELANNGVVTIEQCAALTLERLKECGLPTDRFSTIHGAIRKAKALLSSRDDVQPELLVSGTSYILLSENRSSCSCACGTGFWKSLILTGDEGEGEGGRPPFIDHFPIV